MSIEVPRKVEAKLIDEKKPIERRRVTNFLPAINNTDIIKKFFAGVGDHLFQPEQTEKLSGFIGRIPSHAKLDKEFYINEPTPKRIEYQLEPTVLNTNIETGDTENILFYEDMANLLRLQGGIDNNHDRLFETDSYSWSPPVDLDKLMNFTNYFWFETGPDVVRITDLTDVSRLLGTADPITIQGIDFFDGMRVVFTNDVEFLFRNRVFIVSEIEISFDLTIDSAFEGDVWDDIGWDEGPWDGPDPQLLVALDPDYIIMERGARDGNPWSVGNRWYHRNDLDKTQLPTALEKQAQRPIIEFIKDLELFNRGTFGRNPVTVRDDVTTDPDFEIVGRLVPLFIDGILLANNDTILFTQSPELQGTWDIEGWDLENAPDGIWDQFFNVVFSAPPNDIINTVEVGTGFGKILTLSGDFIAAGFVAGMAITLQGTTDQDGNYIIGSVTPTLIILTTPFSGSGALGLPQPTNVTILEQRTQYRNRVFRVGGIGLPGGITLTLVIDGQDPTGAVADGDQIKVLLGVVHQGKEYYWSDAENNWLLAQEKLTINQFPLFQLYDTEAIQLQDPGKYPFSDFEGSRLFGYQVNDDPRQPLDSVLGFPVKFNDFGEPTFENYLVTERYNFNIPLEEIKGFYFHRTLGNENTEDFFGNDWYLKSQRSRQFIADTFLADDNDVKDFDLSLAPENEDEVQVFVNGLEKTDRRWTIDGNNIDFFEFFSLKDRIRVRYHTTENLPKGAAGNYEIPDNLEANPDNQEITFIGNADFFEHFTGTIKNQIGFNGNPNGTNNWRTTPKDLSFGTKILQHRAPLLKLMILGSNRNIDFMRSVRYVEREYSRFRNKFLRKINEFFNDGVHFDTDPASGWVEDAIVAINIGKINEFPFAFSGMGTMDNGEPTFMPSSPSRLGVFPVYTPEIYKDTTFGTPRDVIQMHDGSIIVAFGDFRDTVILELENNIFDSIPSEYKEDVRPDFDWLDFVESEFRAGDYSIEEFNLLLIPILQRWAINNGLNLFEHTDFNPFDPFTHNYSKQGLPGYWRGIFKFFYDTDRPNTHPWEMFGFFIKPDWWELRYGVAPYKSTNTLLWDDMKVGRIASGSRFGLDPKFARPAAPIPVDGDGNILDPVTAGLATLPGIDDARADWSIGDHAPVETAFRRSEFWSFAIAQISYLMKPARFIELGWDPRLQLFRYTNQEHPQWIDTSTEDRKRHSEFFVHGEILEDESRFLSDGVQQWITEFVVNNGQDITTTFGNVIRTVSVKLGHRMAGFINTNTMRVIADNFGLVPQEDITNNTYLNPSIREEVYSGVIIERVEEGWAVLGYDILDPIFRVLPSIPSGRKTSIDVGAIRVLKFKDFSENPVDVPYNTVFGSQQEVFDFLIGYGRFLESKGWIFDEIDQTTNQANDWTLAGKQFLFWSLGKWATGSLIAVSPLAQNVKFAAEQGTVQSIEQVINGLYGILDREGRSINPVDTFVSRFENQIQVLPKETDAIFSVRLVVAEFEHVLTFNNRTIFNDLIYDPLFRLRQARFKLTVARAGDWKGRIDAPGYLVFDNSLIPNYEKTVNDFRRYFEIEDVVERPSLQDNARNLINFRPRDYMDDLLLTRETQFQFYQGFIRQKGTKVVFDRLLRSNVVSEGDEISFFEEWALRDGEFGAVQDSTTVEFLLRESEWRSEPQLIEFKGSVLSPTALTAITPPLAINETDTELSLDDTNGFPTEGLISIGAEQILYSGKSLTQLTGLIRGVNNTTATSHNIGEFVGLIDNRFDDIITISNDDERWIRKAPENGVPAFPFRNLSAAKRNKNAAYFFRTDNKVSGYPLETEVTFHVEIISELNDIFDTQRITLEAEDLIPGDIIWVDDVGNFYDDTNPNSAFNFGFMVYRFTDTGLTYSIPQLPLNAGDRTVIITNIDHGFEEGRFVMIDKSEGTNPDINGGYLIELVTTHTGGVFSSPVDGDTIVINGITVTLDGTTIDEVISSINGANILNILAFEESNKIRLINIENEDIILEVGTPASVTGEGGSYSTGVDIDINGSLVALDTGTAEISGTAFVTYTNTESIFINTVEIFLNTGTDVDSAIIDINDEAIPGIVASKSANALTITFITATADPLVLAEGFSIFPTPGTALTDLGFSAGTIGALSTIEDAVTDINAAAILDITVTSTGNKITISNTGGGDVVIAEGFADGILDDLGLIAGTFKNALTLISFTAGTFSATATDAFTINNNIQQDDNDGGTVLNGTINIFTESRFLTEADRNIAADTLGQPIPWTTDELVYVDERINPNDVVPLWTVFEYVGPGPSDWTVATFDNIERIQNNKIDVELFKQSLLFNRDTNITDVRLNIWDPAKGLFPGQILDQINYRVEYDSAKYTNGDEDRFQIDPLEAWGERQVGQVWWDLSEVEYVNYETGSNRQRRNQWGRITPGKSITIYEWVRSPVPPTQWADFVAQNEDQPAESFRNKPSGEAFFGTDDGAPFVQRIITNQTTGNEDVIFYFWVQNSETIPNIADRDFSVAQVARQLANPTGQGVPWWAPINEHAIIISGVEIFLTTNDSALQINFNFTQNQNNLHREWRLSREGDERDVPTDRFWNKMVDSLVGFDVENNPVPNPNLEESRKLGNFIRPRQTWFTDREQAGRIFIECVNRQLNQECIVDTKPALFDSLFNKTAEPIESTLVISPIVVCDPPILANAFPEDRPPCEYDRHVANIAERDLLITAPGLAFFEQIWVDGIPETEGFWKVYQFQCDGTFKEVCTEAFRLEDFWTQIDFVQEGVDLEILPDITVDTIGERDALPPQEDGTTVRVNDSNSDGQDIFAIFKFDSSDTFNPWVLIAKEDCTLEFNVDLFYDTTYGNIDVLTGLEGRDLALKEFLNALRNDISTDLEENLLFYKMLNYVHSEQSLVDWAFKTTYIFVVGLNRAANQDPIAGRNPTQSFIDFILEAKPYHTKLRDFVTNEDFGLDIHETNVTDFDKPVSFDTLLDEFRVLDPNDFDDQEIMNDPDALQNDWFINFQSNPDLIRQLNTTILFDRVSCDISGGWDPLFGWDIGPNENWDLVASDLTETAADRILRSYQPQPLNQEDLDENRFDPIVDLQTLISGCDFRGTLVEGFDFNIIDIDDIDTFLNPLPSQVTFFDGDGIETTFAIPLTPETPTITNTKVFLSGGGGWSDDFWSQSFWSLSTLITNGGLQVEGVDYTFNATEIIFNVAPLFGTQIIITVGEGILFANPGAPVDSADIIVDGNLFRQPNFDSGHPEELALNTVGEAISICVGTKNVIGAPNITTRRFSGILGAGPYSIGQTPASKDATFVYINGVRIEQNDFDIDLVSNTILFLSPLSNSITPNDFIVITSFSVGGAEGIVNLEYFEGDGSTGPFLLQQIPATPESAFVTINGEVQQFGVDYIFSIGEDEITFLSPTLAADEIMVVTFESDIFTTILTTEVIVTIPIIAPASNTYSIGQDVDPSRFTGNTIVTGTIGATYINGEDIFINGVNVVLSTGTTVADAIIDINAAAISNVTVTDVSGALRISSAVALILVEGAGTALADLGLIVGTTLDNLFVDINGIRQRPFSPTLHFGWSIFPTPWSIVPWSTFGPINFDYKVNFDTNEVIFINFVEGIANPTFNINDSIFINGIEVILTGITVESVISNINSETITDIIAVFDDSNTRLKIVNTNGGAIELASGVGTALADLGFTPGTFHSILKKDDVVLISSMKNDFVLIRKEFDGITTTFGTVQDLVVEEQVDVKINGSLPLTLGVDFTVDISNNEITIITSMTQGDLIEILIYYVSTEAFDGNTDGPGGVGEYTPLIQPITEPLKTFVYVNGIRQRNTFDFVFVDGGTKLRFNIPHLDFDDVIITTLTGRAGADPIAFRLFLDNFSSLEANEIKPLILTQLSANLIASGTTIELESTTSFPETGILIIGTDLGTFINYEFIQYDNVDNNTSTVEVIQRGFDGTLDSSHLAGDLVLILDQTIDQLAAWKAFRISNVNKAQLAEDLLITDTDIHLDRVAGLPKQGVGETSMTIPGVIWIENERIEYFRRDGKVLKQIRRGTQGTSSGIPATYDTAGNLTGDGSTGLRDGTTTINSLDYPAGTIVIDGTKKQEIPGGYRFEITPFGLQFSNSAQARFLKAKPGTC